MLITISYRYQIEVISICYPYLIDVISISYQNDIDMITISYRYHIDIISIRKNLDHIKTHKDTQAFVLLGGHRMAKTLIFEVNHL